MNAHIYAIYALGKDWIYVQLVVMFVLHVYLIIKCEVDVAVLVFWFMYIPSLALCTLTE